MVLLAGAVIVVFTGPLAERAGAVPGLGRTAVTVWSIAKWPVLSVLVSFMIAVLYRAAPNGRDRSFRWVSPGSVECAGRAAVGSFCPAVSSPTWRTSPLRSDSQTGGHGCRSNFRAHQPRSGDQFAAGA
ncbi:YhjD/YihY/BrkB family envelope integrity protein, partial [Kitasatospora sp. NPDC001539]|uniref:YhjD/YihY/BrkB family envelope integrity protein n=1 Tax=Kitasatospora sp. NPDC001539 TaxID=3154384 RepID=UPI00331FE974